MVGELVNDLGQGAFEDALFCVGESCGRAQGERVAFGLDRIAYRFGLLGEVEADEARVVFVAVACVLAKMAATTDIIAEGRLVFGIGAGGALLPPQHPLAAANTSIREFEACGIPVVPAAKAIADLAEACTICRRMWTEQEPFDFDGASYQLKAAVCEPKPIQKPHPPIMIGSGGEKL